MRILMISDVYFPRVNGVSTSIQTFKNEFEKLNHEVILVVPSYGNDDTPDETILRIPSRKVIFDPEDRLMKYGELLQLTEHFAGYNFDLAHIHTPFMAHYAGKKITTALNLPTIETYHTLFEEYLYHYVPLLPKQLMRAAARIFTRAQCNDVDAIISPSTAMKQTLLNYGIKQHIDVIPTGIQLDKISSGDGLAFKQKHGIPEDRPLLVHVGRAAHEKNIDFLLTVISHVKQKIPEILLVIAGEGPALSHLRGLTNKLNIEHNVLFVGYLDRASELMDCYCAGDAFIFASNTETQGLVLLESMALGTPVISTAVMGTKDILASEKGALVSQEDVAEFSDCIAKLIGDKKLRDKLSTEAQQYADQWSAQCLANKMLDFYQLIVQSWQPDAALTESSSLN